jgi:hypothetical protein
MASTLLDKLLVKVKEDVAVGGPKRKSNIRIKNLSSMANPAMLDSCMASTLLDYIPQVIS